MARRIRCPECDERITLPPQPDGKRLTCEECGHKFRLPEEDDEDDEPVRRSSRERDDDENEGRRPRKSSRSGGNNNRDGQGSSIPVAAWVGGGVVAFLLVCGGVVLAVRSGKKPADPVEAPQIAQAEKDEIPKENNRPEPKPNVNLNWPPVLQPRKDNPRPNPVPRAKTDPDDDLARTAGWAVTPDPLERPAEFAARNQTMTVPLEAGASLYLPSTVSPYFATGITFLTTGGLTVYDTRTKQAVGAIRGKTDLQPPITLSPDGRFIAGKSGFKSAIDIYDFSTGKGARSIDPKSPSVQAIDFGANGEVVVVGSSSSFGTHLLQTWSLATGTMTRSITLPKQTVGDPFLALSPGRHLAAVVVGSNVWVYRLADGKVLGSRPIPELTGMNNRGYYSTCEGLAFSFDGTELAALIKTSQRTQIAAWNVATGKLEINHEITDTTKNGLAPPNTNNLEYLPDGLAWLVHSSYIIDRQSGSTLMQTQSQLQALTSKRRILPNDLILMPADGPTSKKSMVVTPFDRAAFDTAAQAARGAKTDVVTNAGNRAGVKAVPTATSPTWAVTVDPITVGKRFASSIPLASPGIHVRAVVAGAPESAQVATVSIVDVKVPFQRSVGRWDRYDCSTGQHLGAVELGTVKNAPFGIPMEAALSPKGDRIAVRSMTEQHRIDVWSSDGKSLGGFLAAASGTSVGWLGFIAPDKLLTLAGNQVTLWDVPSFKAVYETGPRYRGIGALSANRRWLAVSTGNGFDILDTATGESRGHVPAAGDSAPNMNRYAIAAFSPDGTKLAGLVSTPTGGGTLVVCELASGKVTHTIQTLSPHGHLHWCGANHVLHDSNLMDLQAKMIVWNYGIRGQAARELIDGRYWHTEDNRLLVSTLPDGAVNKLLASVQQPGAQLLVGPGTSLSIQMNMPGEGDPNFAKDVTTQLTQYLEQKGIVVGANAPVTLSVTSAVEQTADRYEIREIGGGNSKRTIPVKKLTVTMTLNDRAGRAIWQEKQVFSQTDISRFFKGDEDPEKILAVELWNKSKGWVASPRLPSRAFVVGGNLVTLPGNSAMTPDR